MSIADFQNENLLQNPEKMDVKVAQISTTTTKVHFGIPA